MGYLFTSDEHMSHTRILEYCKRPFSNVEEMNAEIINRHNSVVGPNDIVVHVGDFTLISDRKRVQIELIQKLTGNHIFLKGSHDRWLQHGESIWEKTIEGQHVVACHYAMRVWPRSHYNSILCYGHSHGRLLPEGKSWDVGVDNNNFYQVSWEQLKEIMSKRPDNFNLVRKKREEPDALH